LSINVYSNSSFRNASSIKFGSYDEKAIDPTYNKGKPTMFTTNSLSAWSVSQNLLVFGTDQITGTYEVNLNPGLPFIYVPDTVFASISSAMSSSIKEFTCNDSLNICKTSIGCDKID